MNWQDISTAPQDGTEVLCWREDCGPFIGKYTSVDSFPLTQAEIDAMDEESLFHKDWFTQWPQAFRLDGSEAPTHWMPLPAAPGEPAMDESFEDLISDWAHGDALDAERWRELLRFVGGHYSPTQGVWFSVTHLKAIPGTNITDGRVEDHFTKAVDAAITDRAKESP